MRAATSSSEPESISAWLPEAGGYSRQIETAGAAAAAAAVLLLELRGLHRRADPGRPGT